MNAYDTHRTMSRKEAEKQSEAIQRVQERLQKEFATNVSINHTGKKGKIEIEYYAYV